MRPRPRLLLVGGGAVQRELLVADHRLTDVFDVTWVAPASIAGGHTPQVALAGRFRHPARDSCATVERLSTRLVSLRPLHRRACLADGQTLSYDVAACAIGTHRLPRAWTDAAPELGKSATAPLIRGHSPADLRRLAAMLGPGPAGARVVVTGESEQALSIVEALNARPELMGRRELWLLRPGAVSTGRRLRRRLRCLVGGGVHVVGGVVPATFTGRRIVAEDGRRFAADVLIWADAPGPSPTAAALGGRTNARGVCVDRYFRVAGTQHVYATGAMACLVGGHVLSGEDAADQARVLAHNLIADWQNTGRVRYRRPSRSGSAR